MKGNVCCTHDTKIPFHLRHLFFSNEKIKFGGRSLFLNFLSGCYYYTTEVFLLSHESISMFNVSIHAFGQKYHQIDQVKKGAHSSRTLLIRRPKLQKK